MKKTFLLLMAGVIAATANGQQAVQSVMFNNAHTQNSQGLPSPGVYSPNRVPASLPGGTTANVPQSTRVKTHRTTSACTNCRWYDYSGIYEHWLDSMNGVTTVYNDSLGFSGLTIWQDTTNVQGLATSTTASEYVYQPFTSYGMLFDPLGEEYNDPAFYGTSDIAVSSSTAYSIDSVQINGWYNRDFSTAYKRSVVDTLVIAFVQGNPTSTSTGNLPVYAFVGSGASPYGVPFADLAFGDMGHDSVNNRAGAQPVTSGTATPLVYTGTVAGPVYKFLLKATDTNGSNSNNNTTFPRAAYNGVTHSDVLMSYPVSANQMVGMSVSFISGDTGYHSYHAMTVGVGASAVGDTLDYSVAGVTTGYKYGNWTGEFFYDSNLPTTSDPEFGPWMVETFNDWTCGFFKREGPGDLRDGGWGGDYEPNWSWSTASDLQYPLISFHVECPTCGLIGNPDLGVQNVVAANTVNAFPNPAANQVNVSYTLVNSSAVTVTLTNMLGQVVATQKMANANTGTAVFNTTAIPDGLYIYTLEANGNRSTGRVSVAH
jgi:hypothetical protein